MSITSILNTGLSALLANQTALRTTASNISNANTPGYVRRTVDFETIGGGSLLGGVGIASIDRAVDKFLTSERLNTASDAAGADVADRFLDQLQASMGGIADGRDPASRWAEVSAQLTSVANDPSSAIKRTQLLQALGDFTQGVQTLSDQVQTLRAQADSEIGQTVTRINELIDQISNLNVPVQRAVLSGDTATPLLDQRDAAIRELSSLMEVRVEETASGRVNVTTPSGFALVTQSTSEVRHVEIGSAGPGSVFPSITVVRRDPQTGAQIGATSALEPHLSGGKLKALLDMRDETLPAIADEIGALAAGAAEALNAAHNASTSVPPPTSMTGRDTGLLATDSLGFTGASTFAVVSSTGMLVKRIDVDFSAGTLSVDGGAATAFTQTVGGFTAALNTALGGNGSASFNNGVLSLSATGGNGIAIQQDASNPSDRAGRGFSHAFGLNDLVVAEAPSTYATGLSASDAHGFTAGQQFEFSVRAQDGSISQTFSYTVTGTTVGDVVSGLNAAAGSAGSFALDSEGRLTFTAANGGSLQVSRDTTERGGTSRSLSSLFGLGQGAQALQASGFAVRPNLAQNPSGLATAQLDLASTTTAGALVLASADSKGAEALLNAASSASFSAAGSLSARVTSIQDFASGLVVGLGQRAASATAAAEDAQAMADTIEQRAASSEGVNVDEELAAMMMYQQAYNAGARVMTTAQSLYDTLLSIMK